MSVQAVCTIVRDTKFSCGGPLTWKVQIHYAGHRVNFDHNLPSSCFVVQYNSSMSIISNEGLQCLQLTLIVFVLKKARTKLCLLLKISGVEVTPSITSVESSEQF